MGQPAVSLKGAGTSAQYPGQFSPRLVSLAILKENWNQGQTYLDTFLPFVADCLRTAMGPVTAADVQKSLKNRFTMKIPHAVVETLLKRATRQGLATRRAGQFEPNHDALSDTVLSTKRDELLRCYSALISELQAFAAGRYEKVLSEAAASTALDAYVGEFGAQTLLQGVAEREFEPQVVVAAEAEYVVHAFVEHLAATDPASFSYFQKIIEGNMLASLVYLPEPDAVQRKLNQSTMYLDTPLLIRALGYAGPELEAPAAELLSLLVASQARLACFESTLSELRGVIQAAASGQGRAGGFANGEVAREFHRRGIKRADADILAGQLPSALGDLHVRIVPAPPHAAEWIVDEPSFQEILGSRVKYRHEATMLRDLEALTAVHRLRQGQRPSVLEDSTAILVTTNTSLVRASREFFRQEEDGHSWPHAMLDTDLATLMWLKTPMRAPDLPRKRIMADCYAALRPSEALWNRWLNEIDRTAQRGDFSDSQLDIMRFSPDAQRALMDTTFGSESALDDNTVEQVLATAEAAITAPVQAELDEQRTLREAAETEAAREREKRESADAAREAAEAANSALESDKQQRHERLRISAERVAKKVGVALFVVLFVLLVAATAVTIASFFVPVLQSAWWLRVVAGGLLVLAVLAGLAGSLSGWNARDYTKKVEAQLSGHLHRRSLRRIGEG